jgi:hypothetical protein
MFKLPHIEVSKIPSTISAVKSTRKATEATLNTLQNKEIKSFVEPITSLQFDLAETCAIYYDNAIREFANQYNHYTTTGTVTA